jgi:hypothetical protein
MNWPVNTSKVGYQTYGEAIVRDETTTSPSSSPIWRRLAHLSG